jgi:hypothetical protein
LKNVLRIAERFPSVKFRRLKLRKLLPKSRRNLPKRNLGVGAVAVVVAEAVVAAVAAKRPRLRKTLKYLKRALSRRRKMKSMTVLAGRARLHLAGVFRRRGVAAHPVPRRPRLPPLLLSPRLLSQSLLLRPLHPGSPAW